MPFNITLEPNKRHYTADADTSLLQAAQNADLVLPYGCRNGACGACKAKIAHGQIDHGHSPESTLPTREREAGMALLCCAQARSDVTIECHGVRAATDILVRKLPCRVQNIAKLNDEVIILTLKLPANDPFRFQAGQYIDFLLTNGARRSFSIANAPSTDGGNSLELHIRHVPGGQFTEHVFSAMKERDILRIEGPLGVFHLHDSNKPLIFLAGGTGFAPIKSIVEDMHNKRIQRRIVLYWGACDRSGLYLHELAQKWAREIPGFRYIPVVSEEVPLNWPGQCGLAHHAVMEDIPDLSNYQVYACGSPAMIDAARQDFVARCKLPENEFFADAFTFTAPT